MWEHTYIELGCNGFCTFWHNSSNNMHHLNAEFWPNLIMIWLWERWSFLQLETSFGNKHQQANYLFWQLHIPNYREHRDQGHAGGIFSNYRIFKIQKIRLTFFWSTLEIPLKYHWNTIEVPLKYPWSSFEVSTSEMRNLQEHKTVGEIQPQEERGCWGESQSKQWANAFPWIAIHRQI